MTYFKNIPKIESKMHAANYIKGTMKKKYCDFANALL